MDARCAVFVSRGSHAAGNMEANLQPRSSTIGPASSCSGRAACMESGAKAECCRCPSVLLARAAPSDQGRFAVHAGGAVLRWHRGGGRRPNELHGGSITVRPRGPFKGGSGRSDAGPPSGRTAPQGLAPSPCAHLGRVHTHLARGAVFRPLRKAEIVAHARDVRMR